MIVTDEYQFGVADRIQTMTESEYRNVQGRLYSVTANKDLADGESAYVRFTTSDKPLIASININSTGKVAYSLYEDQSNMDVSGGTEITPVAFNRSYEESHGTSWYKNPTVNSTGTALLELETFGTSGSNNGTTVRNDSTAGASRRGISWIFAANTEYLIELQDQTNDTNTDTVSFIINFNESEYNPQQT